MGLDYGAGACPWSSFLRAWQSDLFFFQIGLAVYAGDQVGCDVITFKF